MRFEAIVVGGGLCGTLAAQHLAEAGQAVLLLEAGPTKARPLPEDVPGFLRSTRDLTKVDPKRWAFTGPRGYDWHRVRALGGRTLLWGGWMMRPDDDYFLSRRVGDAPWPAAMENMGRWLKLAEKKLQVRQGKPGQLHRRLAGLGIEALAKREAVLPGSRRMLTALDLRPPHVKQATVLSFEATSKGVVVHLEEGRTLRAKKLVLAASPVETARIIEASRGPARRKRIPYADHLIAGVIVITDRLPAEPHPKGKPDQSAVMAPESDAKHRITLELRGPTPLEQLDPDDVKALGFDAQSALTKSFYVVFAMGETDPAKPRVFELDATKKDGLGRPSPRFIKRRHTEREKSLGTEMNATCMRLGKFLGGEEAAVYPIYDALEYGSGGHEVGTCVDLVDERGELREFRGVFVADGSAVPAATDRHPSLTLAANALRVADAARS